MAFLKMYVYKIIWGTSAKKVAKINCLYVRLKKTANIFFNTNGKPGISLNMVNKNTVFSSKIGILLDLTKIFFK